MTVKPHASPLAVRLHVSSQCERPSTATRRTRQAEKRGHVQAPGRQKNVVMCRHPFDLADIPYQVTHLPRVMFSRESCLTCITRVHASC